EIISGIEQVWTRERMAEAWDFANAKLGGGGTGTEMGDEASKGIILPSKAEVVAYAQTCFSRFESCLEALTLSDVQRPIAVSEVSDSSVLDIIFSHLTHD